MQKIPNELTFTCINRSWGNIWEADTSKYKVIELPLSWENNTGEVTICDPGVRGFCHTEYNSVPVRQRPLTITLVPSKRGHWIMRDPLIQDAPSATDIPVHKEYGYDPKEHLSAPRIQGAREPSVIYYISETFATWIYNIAKWGRFDIYLEYTEKKG